MDLIDLTNEWKNLKFQEDALRKQRLFVEKEIEKIIDNDKQEGTKAVDIGHVKVSVQNKVTRKIITEEFEQIKDLTDWPIRVKYEIDLAAMRQLASQDTEKYKIFLSCVETKPAKATISIKEKS